MIDMYLYDDEEQSQVQFVGFVSKHSHYGLILARISRHCGKALVSSMQTDQFGIIGSGDIEEEGYVSRTLGVSKEEAGEIIGCLNEVVQ